MDARKLPRLRKSLRDGDIYLEFASWPHGLGTSLCLDVIAGVSEATACEYEGKVVVDSRRFGVLHTMGGTSVPTKHSYAQLVELVCPEIEEGEW